MSVRLRVLGVQTREGVDHKKGMTVGQVLSKAGVERPRDATITVNGAEADLNSRVADNNLVVVTPNVRNG